MIRIFEDVFTLDDNEEGIGVGTVAINIDKIVYMTEDTFDDNSFTTSINMDDGTVLCVAKPISDVCKILCGARL